MNANTVLQSQPLGSYEKALAGSNINAPWVLHERLFHGLTIIVPSGQESLSKVSQRHLGWESHNRDHCKLNGSYMGAIEDFSSENTSPAQHQQPLEDCDYLLLINDNSSLNDCILIQHEVKDVFQSRIVLESF